MYKGKQQIAYPKIMKKESHTTTEQWKQIEDFPNYEVSTRGNVRSLSRIITNFNGCQYPVGGRTLIPSVNSKGYTTVKLSNEEGSITKNVHRLVMLAHVPNEENLPVINHIDENKTNNCTTNLEWCSYSHNARHNGANIRRSKWVYQYDLDDNLINVFRTTNEVCKEVEGTSPAGISMCCNGYLNSHAGYNWSYTNKREVEIDKIAENLQRIAEDIMKRFKKVA